jgi:hypothetical protein
MSHLSREELVDSLDGPLPAARQAHADACPRCAAERASLARVVQEMSLADVPEPSPLFWDRLSARVRESLAAEPAPATAGPGWLAWLGGHWAWPVVTAALCITVAGIGWQEMRTSRTSPLAPRQTAVHAAVATSEDDGAPVAGRMRSVRARRVPRVTLAENATAGAVVMPALMDEDWNLMMRVAEDVPWDDDGAAAEGAATGLGLVRPETTDAVVRELSADERRELVRLLHEEMTRPPSS